MSTRAQAKSLIEMGRITVNGKVLKKAGDLIARTDEIHVDSPGFVGRGAFKLTAALEKFSVEIEGKTLMDIGASTGGFTEVLLRRGAAKVFAIDVGRDQLAERLRVDPRVENMEGTHFLDVNFFAPLDGAVVDLSFISITRVIDHIYNQLAPKAWVVALIKPQFEAGPQRMPKDGVIKDAKLRATILEEVKEKITTAGFTIREVIDSPIEGKSGNHEYLAWLSKES